MSQVSYLTKFTSSPPPGIACLYTYYSSFIIIIRQPLCPVVGRRPQHAVSKLPCLVLSSAILCCSSICPRRLATAWLVSLVVFFLSYGLQVMTREVHRLSLRRFICPAQDHFSFLSVHYIYDFCPLTDPGVGPSILLCDVEHTSFHFGLCLFGQCPRLCTIHLYVIPGSTQELYTFHFGQMARLLLKISRGLAYAAQPPMILRCISLSWFFSLRL